LRRRSTAIRSAVTLEQEAKMLSAWHKEDVFNTLRARGWTGPVLLEYPKDWHYVGEA